MKYLYLIVFIAFAVFRSYSQQLVASGNFEYDDAKVSITPEKPVLCLDRGGSSGIVKCNEKFDNYMWTHIESNTIIRGSDKQEIKITKGGKWQLEVTIGDINVLCTKKFDFFAYDFYNSVDHIKQYFENSGFYAIPIWRETLPGLNNENSSNRDISCSEKQSAVKFTENYPSVITLYPEIVNTLNNFKPIKDYSFSIVESNNTCLCENGMIAFENQFISGEVNFWGHQYFASKDNYDGVWYVKMNIPGEEGLPLTEQASHLYSIHQEILSENNLQDQARVLISNLVMAHPIGGYEPEVSCIVPQNQIEGSHFLTPAQIAIKKPNNATDLIFSTKESHPNLSVGTLIQFNTSKKWQGYYKPLGSDVFLGYYNDKKSQFNESFSCELNSCNGCEINITTMIESCDGSTCNFETQKYTIEYFNQAAIFDGGYGYEISKCEDQWTLIGISEKESKNFVYNLMCAIKNNDLFINFEDNFRDKVIFGKDIYIGEAYFPFVGVVMPETGNVISLETNPELKNDGPITGFENSFKISRNDDNVRLNFFSLGNYNFNDKACSKLINPSYENDFWNTAKWFQIKTCLSQSPKINEFIDYIYPPDQNNLLIFVNGYRFNGSIIDMVKNGRIQFPEKEPSFAVNICNDNYVGESGNYWEKTGNSFVEQINNKNVIYVDGHSSISTSNHLRMISAFPGQVSFAASLLPCLTIRNIRFQPGCNLCALNETPNPTGFTYRYDRGKQSGQEI